MTETAAKNKEIERNYSAFSKKLPKLLETHAGKFALLRHEEVVEFFDSARDAYVYGQKEFEDGLFSVQEVSDTVVDLGWFSHAPAHTAV